MPTLTEERTIGEIAAEFPASVRIFEKYDIDYCCGGRISLADAPPGRGSRLADRQPDGPHRPHPDQAPCLVEDRTASPVPPAAQGCGSARRDARRFARPAR